MSSVYRCDRCQQDVTIGELTSLKEPTRLHYNSKRNILTFSQFDFCLECMHAFKKWIAAGPVGRCMNGHIAYVSSCSSCVLLHEYSYTRKHNQ